MQVRFGEIFKFPLKDNRWELSPEDLGPGAYDISGSDYGEYSAYPDREPSGDFLVIRTNTKPHEDAHHYNVVREVTTELESSLQKEDPGFLRKVLDFVDAQVAEKLKKSPHWL